MNHPAVVKAAQEITRMMLEPEATTRETLQDYTAEIIERETKYSRLVEACRALTEDTKRGWLCHPEDGHACGKCRVCIAEKVLAEIKEG